ncbi:hypothetical protein [Klebsiella pneumoniae]|uniref:hypothetical protein n=1 Tax=Klebsiella pneumoniae TaxID=573 RepID=UPI0037703CEB
MKEKISAHFQGKEGTGVSFIIRAFLSTAQNRDGRLLEALQQALEGKYILENL